MTQLTVWDEAAPQDPTLTTQDADEIGRTLAALGVRFDRWPVKDLAPDASDEEVLAAYADEIAAVREREGYTLVDVVRLRTTDDPDSLATAEAARAKFLDEHRHDDDEDRFFVRGSGVFYLRLDGKVHAVLCEAGDLISVPANTTHWFDMGTRPDFVSVRFFHDDEGWVGHFTGSTVAREYATYDELAAAR